MSEVERERVCVGGRERECAGRERRARKGMRRREGEGIKVVKKGRDLLILEGGRAGRRANLGPRTSLARVKERKEGESHGLLNKSWKVDA